MDVIQLSSRTKNDKKSKLVHKNKKVPGIIYGKKIESKKIFVDYKLISDLAKNKGFYSKILSIELNGNKEKVLPKEVQYHPITDNVIHIDFMRVQENTKVTVEVPVDFLNREICPGIKQGGVLNLVRRTVELRCIANMIPETLEFDLIDSEIGDSIKISNIKLPEGVWPTITGRDFVIATLVPPTIEAEPEKTEEVTEGEEKVEGDSETKETSKEADKEDSTESKTESKEIKTEKKEG
jgi:large subunit ribosomal protein L25